MNNQVHSQLNNINRDLSNQILSNTNLTPTQRGQLITQLFNAYQSGSDAMDKEFADQTKAAKDLFDKLNVMGLVTDLRSTIDKALTDQTAAATDLTKLPATLATNINGHYVVIEKAVIATKEALSNARN